MDQPARPHRTLAQRAQELYIRILLRLLPLLLSLFRHASKRIQAEIDYLEPGCTFMLTVGGTGLSCACRRTPGASFKRVPPDAVAQDVEPGSGLPSADASAATVDYVIAFRSPAYAFACFSGAMTLQDALAQRAFSTRGPNSTGVALTYLFTALLKMFFGWRAAYRAPKRAAEALPRPTEQRKG
ncbi:D-alanyl-D-alanine carboxypeptidase [Paraeggerthella hongkongensis]|uniref:D-alanyl-D-alanine carboxypeptidase n=1 Tax=Paraeggerthella hongkongensis TaxID=230658 RepID=A0A3N0BM79_9ACTN|nr:D-alanyl-D-alanine carboxypeptidase [Paraeggerthella hongkongensis]RNL49096.1 D-alanyl-D-alanine carboxypeptidase [Paraeggerthella hongkongensis]